MDSTNLNTSENNETSHSLLSVFRKGQTLLREFDECKYSEDATLFATQLDVLIGIWSKVFNMIAAAELFSSNEEVEDISTFAIKYLLTPFYVAQSLQKVPLKPVEGVSYGSRLDELKRARVFFAMFVRNCISLQVADQRDISIFNRKVKLDAHANRDEKIARLKLKKELEGKLADILKRKKSQSDEEEEEELEREHSILLLKIATKQSLDELEAITQELEILEFMAKTVQEGKSLDALVAEAKKQQPAPFKTFVIDHRKKIRDSVFSQGSNLPTVTIEEAGEIDYHIAMQKAKEAEENPKKEVDSDDEVDDDQVWRKKRKDDDWKDENPRGSGNTGNTGYVF